MFFSDKKMLCIMEVDNKNVKVENKSRIVELSAILLLLKIYPSISCFYIFKPLDFESFHLKYPLCIKKISKYDHFRQNSHYTCLFHHKFNFILIVRMPF